MLSAAIAIDCSPWVRIAAPFVTATAPPSPALPPLAENVKRPPELPASPACPATLWANMPKAPGPRVSILPPTTSTVTAPDVPVRPPPPADGLKNEPSPPFPPLPPRLCATIPDDWKPFVSILYVPATVIAPPLPPAPPGFPFPTVWLEPPLPASPPSL